MHIQDIKFFVIKLLPRQPLGFDLFCNQEEHARALITKEECLTKNNIGILSQEPEGVHDAFEAYFSIEKFLKMIIKIYFCHS